MTTRNFQESDLHEVIELYKNNNLNDVFLPDLINDKNVTDKIVYINDNKIIGFTCVNLIPEIIMVHDKNQSIKTRYMLFRIIQDIIKFISRQYIQVYCFCDNPSWIHHLNRSGFKLYEKGILYMERSE